MSITTVYVYNSVRFDSEELAQQAAQQLAASIHNLPCSFCTVTVVEAHPNKYAAWIINPVAFNEDCRGLSDSDSRFFNISDYVSGLTFIGVQAPELKETHRECFDRYVSHKNLTIISKHSWPSNIDEKDLTPEDLTVETISVTANFNYESS